MTAGPTPLTPAAWSALQPAAVWQHFATLCAIPRASTNEALLRERLLAWAAAQGLAASADGAGNLIITKPASAGHQDASVMVLQAHLDMVCQKNAECAHDFLRDPIAAVRRGDWLSAEQTTLGADNGIGVALILAVLEDATIVHGPLEALLTIDEECGMNGAKALAAGALRGRCMLNLDTEQWGEFYLGCAGGVDVNVQRKGAAQPLPAGYRLCRISLRGLRGGHSGIDIHEERGNAIKLLVRVLQALAQRGPLRLAALQGGTARNALPREALARVALPSQAVAALPEFLARQQAALSWELRGVDDGLSLTAAPEPQAPVMASVEQHIWLASLHAAPHGVRRMSRQVLGVVETSNNLGMVDLDAGGGSCNFLVRSLQDEGAQALAEEIASLFSLSGTPVEICGQYPGWAPDPDSPLLTLCQTVFRREFGTESLVKVIHAGLECGIIKAKYPDMDIVSFGPTIRGAHAPGESVEISSVERCWQLLKAILAQAASAGKATTVSHVRT
ncbi:Cytosol non-specific dipeptidase [Burkholderiales bacterium]|nr:Cytosol non-specific dipeptidase [Burkholderiales bacterium]